MLVFRTFPNIPNRNVPMQTIARECAAGIVPSCRTTVRPGLLLPTQFRFACTRYPAETQPCALDEPGFGIRTPAMFSKANLPAGTHSSYPSGSTLGSTDPPATQCCITQPKAGELAAFTIIAQSFPRWHRSQQLNPGANSGLRVHQEHPKSETQSQDKLQGTAFCARGWS